MPCICRGGSWDPRMSAMAANRRSIQIGDLQRFRVYRVPGDPEKRVIGAVRHGTYHPVAAGVRWHWCHLTIVLIRRPLPADESGRLLWGFPNGTRSAPVPEGESGCREMLPGLGAPDPRHRRRDRDPRTKTAAVAAAGRSWWWCAAAEIIAADCKRVTVLKYFLEALCGQEEPLLAFKGGKYVSVAPGPDAIGKETGSPEGNQLEDQDDVVIEEFAEDSEPENSGAEHDFRELRAKKQALARKVEEQKRRQQKIQAVLDGKTRHLELEICPLFLVPDTNGFINHLPGLQQLLSCQVYILVIPLIVIHELDGLAKGQDVDQRSAVQARSLQEKARKAIQFLEHGFEARDPFMRALTSRGNELESIAFRSEDISGQKGNNDDLILSCCLHYCKDNAKDFMPSNKDDPIRLRREVVLLTDDRNLRVKALTRHVPVRDIPAFLKWAKVG